MRALGYSIKLVQQPDPDLLVLHIICVHWVDHLRDCNAEYYVGHRVDLQDGGIVDVFVRKKILY